MGIVWMVWPREADAMAEGDLGQSMLLLFRQRPGAVQKLTQWMERWGERDSYNRIPESFKRICKQAYEAAQQDAPWVPFCTHQIFSESHLGFRFVLGRFHPLAKQLKVPLPPHHPSISHRLEAIDSGSRWHIMSPNV